VLSFAIRSYKPKSQECAPRVADLTIVGAVELLPIDLKIVLSNHMHGPNMSICFDGEMEAAARRNE